MRQFEATQTGLDRMKTALNSIDPLRIDTITADYGAQGPRPTGPWRVFAPTPRSHLSGHITVSPPRYYEELLNHDPGNHQSTLPFVVVSGTEVMAVYGEMLEAKRDLARGDTPVLAILVLVEPGLSEKQALRECLEYSRQHRTGSLYISSACIPLLLRF